jgi:2-oxo-4-hydroxy-4-carboxy--5-ureidoimidazoline (OHCU) decarboxylase
MASLPPSSTIKDLPQEQQFRTLDTLFESSPELHTLMAPVLAGQSFSSYPSLIDAVGGRMSALSAAKSPTDRDILVGILGSHPRLGQRKSAAPEHLSELSKQEQSQLNTGAEEQAEKLRLLNAEYEDKFPGLRFVYAIRRPAVTRFRLTSATIRTFVNGRSRDVIMEEMRARIDRGDGDREVEETIQVSLLTFQAAKDDIPNRAARPCVISQKTGRGSWGKNDKDNRG